MSRILIVDDDEVLVKTLMAIFRRAGHTVLAALDGRSAACAARRAPDLIILDVMMPGWTGWRSASASAATGDTRSRAHVHGARQSRSSARRRAGPRRASSGLFRGRDLADDYIAKPVIVDVSCAV